MSLTEAVRIRSLMKTIRVSISSAGIPVYCQTTLTTGMSICGKMSVDMRKMDTAPSPAISNATTASVSNRRGFH